MIALVNAGYAVLAFDQAGFGSRMGEFAPFYKRHPTPVASIAAPAQMRQCNQRIAHVVAHVALLPLRAFDQDRNRRLRLGVAERENSVA